MAEELPVRRVEVSFVGAAPASPVARATGVSDVQTDGSTLRCVVCGSFQPFLEALRGHEVVGFDSAPPSAGSGNQAKRRINPRKLGTMQYGRPAARNSGAGVPGVYD
jgi:hypothetical protein